MDVLKKRIGEFIAQAAALQEIKTGIISDLETLMKNEIIPQVEALLPEPYSINPNDSEVTESYAGQDIAGFEISLMLQYDGRAISIEDGIRLNEIYSELNPSLHRIAEDYGLNDIYVVDGRISVVSRNFLIP